MIRTKSFVEAELVKVANAASIVISHKFAEAKGRLLTEFAKEDKKSTILLESNTCMQQEDKTFAC